MFAKFKALLESKKALRQLKGAGGKGETTLENWGKLLYEECRYLNSILRMAFLEK